MSYEAYGHSVKIWSTTDWKALPERVRMKGLFSFNYCGNIYLYQDEGMDEPVVLNPKWPALQTLIKVLAFHRAKKIMTPMVPEGL